MHGNFILIINTNINVHLL